MSRRRTLSARYLKIPLSGAITTVAGATLTVNCCRLCHVDAPWPRTERSPRGEVVSAVDARVRSQIPSRPAPEASHDKHQHAAHRSHAGHRTHGLRRPVWVRRGGARIRARRPKRHGRPLRSPPDSGRGLRLQELRARLRGHLGERAGGVVAERPHLAGDRRRVHRPLLVHDRLRRRLHRALLRRGLPRRRQRADELRPPQPRRTSAAAATRRARPQRLLRRLTRRSPRRVCCAGSRRRRRPRSGRRRSTASKRG